ncbi:MAG: OpgC domain-containing protein [Geminicoccaceae bacterium]|jgi:hypothetical protein|nr:OpgC domain-containing protein [Geminicoccaceae bacterium]HRY23084.1 OpgC domain-containing protein [Geminicoccaceae bacterium]
MSSKVAHSQGPGKSRRDPRLDFFRGIAMLIILVAHIQWNSWSLWIPARFGPSDAAEMFVFCSGYAAAIAFGGTFVTAGFWMGVRRIALRCWQVYWAHLGLFFTVAAITVVANELFGTPRWNYLGVLNLEPFFDDTQTQLVGLFTLTYVPNYFDILPMYLVILAMIPLVMLLHRLHLAAAIAFCILLYVATWVFNLNLPAEPFSDRVWFFNPFGWQIVFFTGFMLSRGWVRPPPYRPWLLALAAGYVLVMIPISRWQIYMQVPALEAVHDWLWLKDWEQGGIFKTNQHPLRWLHLLALAYLALWVLRGREHWLDTAPCRVIIKVGQQALATFMTSMALAWILSIALDQLGGEGTTFAGKYRPGREPLSVAAANIFGLAAIIGVAYMVDWYKREPWRRVGQAPAQSVSGSRAAAQPAAAAPESAALAVAPGARAYR